MGESHRRLPPAEECSADRRVAPDDEDERDPCVVPTVGLATIVREFIQGWERGHPPSTIPDALGRPNSGGSTHRDRKGMFAGPAPAPPPTGIDMLAARTRELDVVYGTGVSTQAIQRVLDQRDRLTELRVADALATAARRPFAFRDGTLPVSPNPYAPPAVRGTCCPGPGSLLGA